MKAKKGKKVKNTTIVRFEDEAGNKYSESDTVSTKVRSDAHQTAKQSYLPKPKKNDK